MSKLCIFCGQKGNKSKEHLWPVWMHDFLEKEGNGANVRESYTFRDTAHQGSKKIERQGYLYTTKFRVVCRNCNNGWMSQAEEAAKPVLLKLVKGEHCSLNDDDQRLVSKWIAMKIIIGEYAEKGLHVTPEVDRFALKEKGQIPDYFTIYISIHGAEAFSGWLRMSYTLSTSLKGPDPSLRGLQRNTQLVAFICGKLFVYVFAARLSGINPSEFLKISPMARIAPSEKSEIMLPNGEPTTGDEINRIAWLLDSIQKHPGYKFGGDLPNENA